MKLIPRKKKEGKCCWVARCKNPPGKKKGGYCNTHYTRKLREEDPIMVRYFQFKHNALRRGKDFSVTLEEFRRFCHRNRYLTEKGRRGRNATIDRRCNVHGYHIWNMQILTGKQNSKKGTKSCQDCPF